MPREYLIDHILPADSVHLLAGPSGVGKTRWWYWVLKQFVAGQPVMGHTSHPCPVAYLAADRQWRSIEETLEQLGCLGLVEQHSIMRKRPRIDQLHDWLPHIKLFLIDPISVFLPGHRLNDYGDVSGFLTSITGVCERDNITLWGSLHTTKEKEGQQFLNPREGILGSAAWGAFTDSIFKLRFQYPGRKNSPRITDVLPRNWLESEHYWKLNDAGWPEETDPSVDEVELFIMFVQQIPTIATERKSILLTGERLGLSRPTIDRYLAKAEELKYVTKPKYGCYQRRFHKIPPDIQTDV